MIRYKFSKEINLEFANTLKSRVNSYFQDNKLSKNANSYMVLKTVAALLLYLAPFAWVMLGGITSIPFLFALWMTMGLGKGFIGMSVMHDALHGSYSNKRFVNSLVGISSFVIGVNPDMWKIQHNVLHHTYTNIEGADEDIESRYVMRFTPNQTRRWFHKYQFIYAAFFYSITTLIWITFKDFSKLVAYKAKGIVKPGAEFYKHLVVIIAQKTLYYVVFLVLPILVLPFSAWIVVLMFLSMHMVTGLLLTLVFQMAHVVPTSDFVKQEDEQIEQNHMVHQILTTSNFAMGNKLLSWFIGGLNFQIEHHLFPNICHIHYHKISSIVQQTALEYNLPYYTQTTFGAALKNHFFMLRVLGRQDSLGIE